MIHEEIFENIDKVIDYLNNQGWTISKNYIGNAPYVLMDYGDGKLIYYPQPIGTPLFRGQNEFHDPCTSSFFRFQPDNYTQFIQKLKLEEFRIVTAKHPVIEEEINNGIFYDYVALAQHYEFKTEMLDVTNSLPVAAFFAVTRQDCGKYIPIEKSDKPGVLYFVTPDIQFMQLSDNLPEIYPVGWQVFKRPGEQRAFGVNLTNKKNFNTMSGVFAFRFWHDKIISEQIWNMFHGGEDLFAKDTFAEKATKIKDSNIFSTQAFDLAYGNSNKELTREMILTELEKTETKPDTRTKQLEKRNIKIQINSIWEYSVDDISALKELSHSGAITENLNATTRLCYIPDNSQSL